MSESRTNYLANILNDLGAEEPTNLAAQLMTEFGSLGALADSKDERLSGCLPGNSQLLACLQAARKIASAGIWEAAIRVPLDPAETDLQRYLLHRLAHRKEEIVLGLFADADGGLISEVVLGFGDGHGVEISAKAVLRRAIAVGAEKFVLVHNHPSGNCSPSSIDVQSTQELDAKSATLGIYLLDHLIVGGTKIFSIRRGCVL